ncbi:MAG: hypothetical protein DDT34_02255 [Firmicutes bacterium]|nr:hypothetical protein [Bacillota bacterium]
MAAELEPRGFLRPSRKFETWVRRRTPYIYDLAGLRFVQSVPSIGMVQVGVNVALHLPVVEKIYHQLLGGIYRIQSGTAGEMLCLAYRSEKLPTAWFFWATAYSEKATQMIVDQIVSYGLPLLEQVTDYESLLAHPFLSNISVLYGITPPKKAILLALVGRTDEAQRLLKSAIEAIEEDEKLRAARYKGSEPQEPTGWKVQHVEILEALKTGRFNELVDKAMVGLKRSSPLNPTA